MNSSEPELFKIVLEKSKRLKNDEVIGIFPKCLFFWDTLYRILSRTRYVLYFLSEVDNLLSYLRELRDEKKRQNNNEQSGGSVSSVLPPGNT